MTQLYYYQPDSHGPYSIFVLAHSKEQAAHFANKTRDNARKEEISYFGYGELPYTPDQFKPAALGEVITNDND